MTFTNNCDLRRTMLCKIVVLVLFGCACLVMCDELEFVNNIRRADEDSIEEEAWYTYSYDGERRLQSPTPLQVYPPSQLVPITPTVFAPVAPTGSSSPAPSLAFVEQQVVSESPSLAPSITAEPSSSPVPTLAPTTRAPTKAPTTPAPTKAPTTTTTTRPTQRPTKAPTPNQTKTPTVIPTKQPTRRPTAAPTKRPTQQPTIPPSPAPTRSPSTAPSPVPSLAPTNLPTVTPTKSAAPTTTTPAPTVSEAPSPQPSLQPSALPTAVASSAPSTVPSAAPSLAPSVPPTGMPTLTLQDDIVRVDMLLISTRGKLSQRAVFDFQSATEGHITQTIETMEDIELEYLFVNAILASQKVVGESATLAPGNRLLQTALRPLEVSLTVLVEYRADMTYSPTEWVSSAFNSDEKQSSFINRLKQIGDSSFDEVEEVKLLVDGTVPIEMDPKESSSSSLGVIIGATAGGALVVALAIVLFVRRSNKKNNTNHRAGYDVASGGGKLLASTEGNTSGIVSNPMSTEILVERQDDISTLGDPVFFGSGAMMNLGAAAAVDRDERTASVGGDYDYAKDYLLPRGSTDDTTSRGRLASADTGTSGTPLTRIGSGPMGASVFDDDASFEQQYDQEQGFTGEEKFDVTVPPGKLGMVIDTPNGSVPIIHAIKADSVLAGKVQVGDRLLSVDSEDVTNLTAVQVSKLISLKSKEERVLAFARGGSNEAKGR